MFDRMNKYCLTVTNIDDVISKGYNGITLVYLLKGSVLLIHELQESVLNAEDILLVNKNEAYQVTGKVDNIVVTFEVPSEIFFQNYEKFYSSHFSLELSHQATYKAMFVEQLRNELSRMIIAWVKNNPEICELEMNSCLCDILLILVRYFKDEGKKEVRNNTIYSKRVENVTQWIKSHYQSPITLKEMAKKEYVSMAYLSRLFKQEVGTNFLHYLMQVRFSHSVQGLITTKDPVWKISQDNGFSSVRQFTQLFKEHYKTTPRLFRKSYGKAQGTLVVETSMTSSRKESEANLTEVFALLTARKCPEKYSNLARFCESEALSIDLAESPVNPLRPNFPREYIIILGRLEEVLRSSTQQQLLKVKKDIGLDYVDVYHSIFSSSVPDIYSMEDKNFTVVCYSEVERAISFLKETGIALLVRIYACTRLSDVDNFLRYCVNVFGIAYLQTWRFVYYSEQGVCIEVLSEGFMPLRHNLQDWLGDVECGIVWPQIDLQSVEAVSLNKYKELAKYIDFIGYCSPYPQRSSTAVFNEDFFTQSESYIAENTSAILTLMKKIGMNVPLYLLEWNTLTGNTYHTNGSFFRGALIFKTIMSLPAQVAGVSLWLNLETQQASLKSADTEIHSLALFHILNMPRPVFQVLKFRERLQGSVIASGENYLITKTHFGYQVYLSNTVTFDPEWTTDEHLFSCFRKKVILKVSHISPGFYQIKHFKLDQKNGALYWQMEQMHTKLWWDDEVVRYLNLRAVPTLNIRDEHIDGVWTTVNELDINAMVFYELRRVH